MPGARANTKPVLARRLIWVLFCLTLQAAPPTVKLAIAPDHDFINGPPAFVLFSARVAEAAKPSSVILCLVDKQGAVLSTHGSLRDDGLSPDRAAGDMEYSLQLRVPRDKVGEFRFIARARFNPPVNLVDSPVGLFDVRFTTPQNREGDLWALPTDEGNYLAFVYPRIGIKRSKFFRAASLSGPWQMLSETTFDESLEEGRAEVVDASKESSSRDWYYKIELYDSASELTKAYSPVFVPAFAENGRLLRLTGPVDGLRSVPAAPSKD
jgi:hypothetical protein